MLALVVKESIKLTSCVFFSFISEKKRGKEVNYLCFKDKDLHLRAD